MAEDAILSARTKKHLLNDKMFIDIQHCVPGAHARAIKPGGLATLKQSITRDGYKRVMFSIHIRRPRHADSHY
jgi:hypothetical protein